MKYKGNDMRVSQCSVLTEPGCSLCCTSLRITLCRHRYGLNAMKTISQDIRIRRCFFAAQFVVCFALIINHKMRPDRHLFHNTTTTRHHTGSRDISIKALEHQTSTHPCLRLCLLSWKVTSSVSFHH